MKRSTLPSVLLLVVSALTLTATAQKSASDAPAVYGVGLVSCGKWIQEKQFDPGTRVSAYDGYRNWVTGFVSGAGSAGAKLRKTDNLAIAAFVDAYCLAHPLDPVVSGARALIVELARP